MKMPKRVVLVIAGVLISSGQLNSADKGLIIDSLGNVDVTEDLDVSGVLTADSGNITGKLTAGSGEITGKITAASSDISGKLTAGSSQITGDLNADLGIILGGESGDTDCYTTGQLKYLNGYLYYCSSNDYWYYLKYAYFSSEKYKRNVQVLTNSLDKVNRLNGVSFDHIAFAKPAIGLIAEEVAEVVPEVVVFDEDGKPIAIEYELLVALLIEGMKEQSQRLEALEMRLVALTQEVHNSESIE